MRQTSRNLMLIVAAVGVALPLSVYESYENELNPHLAALAAPLRSKPEPQMTKSDVDKLMTELSNWGRWGTEDQLGALNFITPDKRKRAASLVKQGVSFSLARQAETVLAADNPSPFEHTMIRTGLNTPGQFLADRYGVNYHGYAHTHIDALCHMIYQGKMFNGFSSQEVTAKGAAKLGVQNLDHGILTRGVLMDLPRLKSLSYLEPGDPIYPKDLEAWEKKTGIHVGTGDVIFIRTGRWARRKAKGPWDLSQKAAGLHASCARWLKEREVSVMGSDSGGDVTPSGIEGVNSPVHQLLLVAMGVWILDNCDLESLAENASRLNRFEFLVTAAPLRITGGTGSPLNPIATF